MKKILKLIIIFITVIFPITAFAAGSITVSPTSLTIEQGSSKSFNITAYNAVGDATIVSSNTSVATLSSSSWDTGSVAEGKTVTGTITVYGNSIGTSTITLTIDGATFDEEDLSGQTKTITVNVTAKQVITEEPTENNSNNNSNSNNNTTTKKNNKSTNNKLKSISIEGYELEKVDDNNYKLTVSNNIEKVKIDMTAEDSKATISGTGEKELKIGENKIELIIKSESGTENKINVNITRKDGDYLEDLSRVLKEKEEDINIIIKKDTVLSKEEISTIKDNKKEVTFDYYDENKLLLYSWTIDGTKISSEKEINLNISNTIEDADKIKKLSNYSEGIYINFSHSGNLPENTKVKLYVKDNFKDNDLINIYYFNEKENTLELTHKNIKVIDGYVELDMEHCSKYFATMSNISTETTNTKSNTDNNSSVFIITIIIELVVIITLVILLLVKKKNKKNKERILKEELSINKQEEIFDLKENNIINDEQINKINDTNPIQKENIENTENKQEENINNKLMCCPICRTIVKGDENSCPNCGVLFKKQ